MSGDSKFFLGIVIAAVVVIGGIILFSNRSVSYTNVSSEGGQKKGPDTAIVKIVEFSDYQCPACAQGFPALVKAQEDNANDVQIIHRHFPLTTIHANTTAASMAAEAAGLQGKFWEMSTLLFANQSSWEGLSTPKSTFVSYAKQLDLNTLQFEKDLTNPDLESKINVDSKAASDLSITSTPTYYINNKKIIGARTTAQWQELINTAKTEATK